jgi:hypothetical protein
VKVIGEQLRGGSLENGTEKNLNQEIKTLNGYSILKKIIAL